MGAASLDKTDCSHGASAADRKEEMGDRGYLGSLGVSIRDHLSEI